MKKALIVVDMQRTFLDNLDSKYREKLISNIVELLTLANKKKIPLIKLEYDIVGVPFVGTIDSIGSLFAPASSKTFVKENSSGFTKTNLHEYLQSLGIQEIILAGINANACVQDTAISALNRKYKVTTSFGLIASVWSGDLSFSRSNLKWYESKTNFMSKKENLISHLNK